MYKPYKTPVMKASPDIKTPIPRVSKFVVFLLRLLGRLYLFLFYGIARIVLQDGDQFLIDAFKRALAGESRCIIAFRHPNGGEPQLLTWFFLFKLRGFARKKGVRFSRWPHAVFVYGYEVIRWGGWAVRYVMPNVGALPVHHAKMDSHGMNSIYKAIIDGQYPVALAPEGQVSYTTDTVPRLEPGVIRIGFFTAEQMAKKGMNCPVEILPVSVYFDFGSWGKMSVEMFLRRIEKVTGFSGRDRKKLSFTERVRRCRDHILSVNEARYNIKVDTSCSFEERLERVIYTALETAERMMGVKGEGDFFTRLYRLRHLCWDQIILPDFDDLKGLTRVKRSTLDLKAGEAWYIGRHQELADLCWYFRVPLPTEDTALPKKIEYVQNLWDFASRTMGGSYADRVSIFPRKVIIQAAPVINLSERLPSYVKSRKTAIAAALSDLERAYLDCIEKAAGIGAEAKGR